MKVLMLVDSLAFGGAETLLLTLAGVAPDVGFTFDVVSVAPPLPTSAALLEPLRAAGVDVSFLGVTRLLQPSSLPKVVGATRRSRADVVHAHLEAATTLGPVAAALAGRPAVCTLHHVPGDVVGREALRERLAVAVGSRSRRMLFVSEASRAVFAQRYRTAPTWQVLPNGVDLDVFRPERAPWPSDADVPPGVPSVLIAGALRPLKGHDVALAAWPEVLRQVPGAVLVLAGTGETEPALRRQAFALGIVKRVRFLGRRSDVARLMQACTLVALPSRTEALPTVLIEAAASAKAAVATRVGGIPEVVAHETTGLLVPPDDPHAFAGAVTRLLLDVPLREEMGARALLLSRQRFDARTWARRLHQVYQEVTGGSSRHLVGQEPSHRRSTRVLSFHGMRAKSSGSPRTP